MIQDQVLEVLSADETVVAVIDQEAETAQTGDMIAAQYHLGDLIGTGSYGDVFVAKDLRLQRRVAVKVLRKDKANTINTRRFLREAQLHGALSHDPNIVSVHDYGRTRGGCLYLVMELLTGRSLDVILDHRLALKRPFSMLECIRVVCPVLKGLHAAHTHTPPVIHRDLKPDNIWVMDVTDTAREPLTKLLDFGIATLADEANPRPAGTRMYASPEQTRKNTALDGRSDLWSVGVLLFQMVCMLYDAPWDPVQLARGEGTFVPPVASQAVTAPLWPSFAAVIDKALQVDKNLRFSSASQMCRALQVIERSLMLQHHNRSEQEAQPPSHPAHTTMHQKIEEEREAALRQASEEEESKRRKTGSSQDELAPDCERSSVSVDEPRNVARAIASLLATRQKL